LQALNYAASQGLDKESLWPYAGTNGGCNLALVRAHRGEARAKGGYVIASWLQLFSRLKLGLWAAATWRW
jgi:hypothetical protein